VRVVFSGKVLAEMTVVRVQAHPSPIDELAISCYAGSPLAVAQEIVCGSMVLNRISVEAVPKRLEGLRP